MAGYLSTHILDIARGLPAAGTITCPYSLRPGPTAPIGGADEWCGDSGVVTG
ncbi:MAG TPA: hypothetical protein VHF70_10625 [Rubrobacteraceae bacterium]|nr:hypothetical protein [Rubrobacteraceae bacterium]